MMLWLVLGLAGFAAGAINAIAGGGSLVSFPALLLTGMPEVAANATNTLAVWPGSITAVLAYRVELRARRHEALALSVPAAIGGLLGAAVLLHTSEQAFRAVVPWLILFACALLSLQDRIAKLWGAPRPSAEGKVPLSLWLIQLAVSVYGGYFGAGMGILMLAVLALTLPFSMQHANAIKVWLGLVINAAAALYFLLKGSAHLPEAAWMALASLAGGWVGAKLARRMRASLLRGVVVAYGVLVALRLLMR